MRLAVCIVTYESAADLPGALRAVSELEAGELELVVVDNASGDGSAEVAERLVGELSWRAEPEVRIVRKSENVGFAAGMNEAIARTTAEWILALNPDARPSPDYVQRLVERAAGCEAGRCEAVGCEAVGCETGSSGGLRVGALTGRLHRPGGSRLDACGMVLRRTWRHLDRGSGEENDRRYGEARRVFGATGAAALYRRQALEDVAIESGVYFDDLFHSYREDAELSFRLGERGWAVVYEPAAECEHRRTALPEGRRGLPAFVNRHSLKNRYLLRAYHETPATLWRTLPFALARDLAALFWVLLFERSSLGAYAWLWRHRKRWLRRARRIRSRRTVPASEVARWFARESLPLP